MLNISVVGIGNAGSQVAALAGSTLKVPVLAINSSEKDIQTLPASIPSILIGDEKGAGKERLVAKKFLKESIMKILSDEDKSKVFGQDIVFIVSSTGGGTGSGASLMMANIIQEVYPRTKVILVGILPTIKEALSTQINTIEYMKELYEVMDSDTTYMIYDNEKLSKLPSSVMMEKINQSIVNDIEVIQGMYQHPTRYSSIDEKDSMNIISTPGRIVIASLRNLKEKDLDDSSIEKMLIEQFKSNTHAEIQRDKVVVRTGIISLLNERLNERFDTHITEVRQFIGAPTEEFEHVCINSEKSMENAVFMIAAGLTEINDRIRRINDRIEEINELQKIRAEESELSSVDMDGLKSKVTRRKTRDESGDADIRSIINKFGI